jgi:hypothetical protein
MAPTSIKWAFLDGENRYPFCMASDILMARLICQPLNREMLNEISDLGHPQAQNWLAFAAPKVLRKKYVSFEVWV